MSGLSSILKFDETGRLVASFGQGTLIFPHGITVDPQGNVWVTDGQDNAPQANRGGATPTAAGAGASTGTAAPAGQRGARGQRGGGAAANTLVAPRPGATKGHQVFKFSPDGRLLMTLGQPAGGAGSDYFYQPNDVLVAPDGSIFVAEGHSDAVNANARILKFDKDGKFIKAFGRRGTGPGELMQPHSLAMDSRGRLFVGDRSNNRISIFDQEGNFIEMWYQFSRPSGIAIDRNDIIYVADSESGSVNPAHGDWKRGIRIGNARTGQVTGFIPDPALDPPNTSSAEGIAVDPQGNIYGAEVGQRALKKYVRR
jgi:DNA-binding beta-propeller fold protein YncE